MQTRNKTICLHDSISTLFVLFAALLLVGGFASQSRADDDFKSAFRSSGLPWYDAKKDDIKSSSAKSRPGSGVGNRNRIPPFQAKPKGQQVVKPAPAPTGGGVGGAAGAAGAVGTSFIYILGGIIALALVALLIYGFLKLESSGGEDAEEESRRKRKIRDHIKHLPFEIEEQDGDFETFAEKALREGDYSKAVIYLFADMLVAMSEAGVVRLQRGKTNRQYLNDIWDHGEIRPFYRKVMTAFEDAFFGKHDIEKSRAEECFAERAVFDQAVEQIRQRKFAASQSLSSGPVLPSPDVRMEGLT